MMVKVDRIPEPGETLLGGEFLTVSGGKGANQAVGAAQAGGAVTLIARVGQDVFGQMALDSLRAHRINTQHVVRDRTSPSGVALICVARNGQNSIAVAPGANSKLSTADLDKAKGVFRAASVLLLQLETPLKTVQAAARLAAQTGTRVILNPAPAQRLPANLLEGLYLLTPNETEVQLLTGITADSTESADRAASRLLSRGVQNIIITMGARGALVAAKGIRHFIPAYKVKAVDATGAGDIFNGALAVAVAEGRTLLEAASFATAAAAISVTRVGAQASAPARMEIEQLLATGKIPPANSTTSLRNHRNGSNGWAQFKVRSFKKDLPTPAGLTNPALP
jgi:ribokinase